MTRRRRRRSNQRSRAEQAEILASPVSPHNDPLIKALYEKLPTATNLEAAGRIIGPEIIKAIGVAGAGTADEREGAQKAFGTAVSPAQMVGAIETTQKLLGGQLEGRKRQASNAGISEERFKSLIGDRPYEILSGAEKGHKGDGLRV